MERVIHGPLIGLAGVLITIAIIVAIAAVVFQKPEERKPLFVVGVVCALAAIGTFAWNAITMASVNETPRATIDRSIANERADRIDQDAREAVKAKEEK